MIITENPFTQEIAIEKDCISCKTNHRIRVKKSDWGKWQRGGGLIQDCMPYLSAGDRELLISGICDKCFNSLFNNEFED